MKPRLRRRPPNIFSHPRPAKPAAAPAAPQVRPEARRQEWLLRIGVLIPLVLLIFTLTRGAEIRPTLPEYLLGTWESSAPGYADCYMEISAARIVFGNAEQGYTLYFVSRFEQVVDGAQTVTVVHYTDLDGHAYQMSLGYNRFPKETIQLKNQPKVLWERRPSS